MFLRLSSSIIYFSYISIINITFTKNKKNDKYKKILKKFTFQAAIFNDFPKNQKT